MSIIIINSRNPARRNSSSARCSLLRTRLNDASGVTMLFAEAGMIFGVPQDNKNAKHVSFPSVIPDNVFP